MLDFKHQKNKRFLGPRKSENKSDFLGYEEEILKFWEEKKIYDKVKKKNEKGKKFYFLQGPPYTSGKLHIAHAWNNSMKDLVMRYKRMQGFNVWDRAGYDMHGLPTENAVQKELNLKDKEEIVKYGLDKFVKKCIEFSSEKAKTMDKDLWRLGIWMDYENAYWPIKPEFIEGEWWFIKRAWEQKRLYKGKKIMQWCSHCETSLAKHELEYENIKENSIFLRFRLKNKKNEYLIVWTTTPWTIPFNLAVMINPDLDYVKAEVTLENGKKEVWTVAKALVNAFVSGLLGLKFKVLEEFKGEKIEGLEYEHPLYNKLKKQYDNIKKNSKNTHTVILSKEYVDTQTGSGLVHCAPGCGPEDYEVGKGYGIPVFNNLDEQGYFRNMGEFEGFRAKEDDKKFIEALKKEGSLITETEVEHEYAHCWRCHSPVVFRATEQWFLKIEDLLPKLLKFNQRVHWVPEFAKKNYDIWTENLKDNGLTRQRFWGAPMPIWECDRCDNREVIGTIDELKKKAGKLPKDLHRPWIDSVVLKCKCGREMKRINDVIDVWIDAGTTSWNCLYFPKNKKLIKEWYPADFILEATEQIRLWFSMLNICSMIAFGKDSYKNVHVHGMILDYQGMKMSKSLGNIISPYEIIDKYNADILRYYMIQTPAGENINFNWEEIKIKQRNLVVLMNTARYLLDLKQEKEKSKIELEEKYILSRKNSTIKKVTELMEGYNIDQIVKEIEDLFLELSRDYIKMVRDKQSKVVFETIKEVYTDILKMFSIISPFISEKLWQDLKKEKIVREESVHLCSWPKYDKKKINKKLEKGFEEIREIIEAGLAERDKVQIGLKWPLAKATVTTPIKLKKELQEIVMRQLNLKKLELKQGKALEVKLDTKMTKELEEEGFAREISRKIQASRKNLGLVKQDKFSLIIISPIDLSKQKEAIKERTNSKEIYIKENIDDKEAKSFKLREKFKVKNKEFELLFKKI